MNIIISFICILGVWVSANKADDATLKYLKTHLAALTQQTMLQQFFTEQRVRTDGQSGIKLIRQRHSGGKTYFTETHSGYSSAAIHDHANYDRTVGLGEFSAVMNGFEFRTRHNDYKLRMPHRTSSKYNAVEDIPFPDVPPEVTAKTNISEQVDEMREWFRAWSTQNHTVRDYRKYFKPVMCYLEGAWTTSGKDIDEPFTSDRHFIDAKSWMELHTKAQFEAYSGSKSLLENLAFLPTKIMSMTNDSIPVFAQWNYRILCHPIKRELPLNRLQVVDDLSSRMMSSRDIYKYRHSRAARFQVSQSPPNSKSRDRPTGSKTLLDEIMEEIPGKDNYQGHLVDEGIDTPTLNDDMTPKDVSRYHRWYRVLGRDAMGTSRVHRGYSDDFLFASRTTQPKVAGKTMMKSNKTKIGNKVVKKHFKLSQKWTYAIPLEIVFLTPLSKWNPYDIPNYGWKAWEVRAGGRNGDCTSGLNKEFLGTTYNLYYTTPSEFYTGGNVGRSNGDTTRGDTCVLDKKQVPRHVRAAGTYVFLPYIKDIGILRQRYPVYPVYGEGSSVWKELNALKDVMMNDIKQMMWKEGDIDKHFESDDNEFNMGYSKSPNVGQHTHDVILSAEEVLQCKGGHPVYKETSLSNGHQHRLKIIYREGRGFMWIECDNGKYCWDKHWDRILKPMSTF